MFKEVYFIDNSTDEPIEVANIKEGKLTEFISDPIKWLQDLLFIFSKIKKL